MNIHAEYQTYKCGQQPNNMKNVRGYRKKNTGTGNRMAIQKCEAAMHGKEEWIMFIAFS